MCLAVEVKRDQPLSSLFPFLLPRYITHYSVLPELSSFPGLLDCLSTAMCTQVQTSFLLLPIAPVVGAVMFQYNECP